MPIPPFDLNSVLPPHLGDPTSATELSPYPCTTEELCERFCTSARRTEILEGFLRLRAELRKHGMLDGFQWIDGSFLENVEMAESRDPVDIDVATFYWSPDPGFSAAFVAAFPAIVDHSSIKADYLVDHYLVDAGFRPEVTIDNARYWCGLFSHTRMSIWKGMLKIDLNSPADDAAAVQILGKGP